jgi:hypothetical protein
VRHPLRLEIRPLHETDAGAERVHPLEILRRAVEARLQDHPHVAESIGPQRLERLQGHLGVFGALHVDPDEEAAAVGLGQDLAEARRAEAAIDIETELGQLEGQVPLDPCAMQLADDMEVLACGGVGRRGGGDALAEVVDRMVQPARFEEANGRDRVGERLAGDEPACEPARPGHAVSRRELPESGIPGDRLEEGLRRRPEHQCVRVDPAVRRWSIVRA